eukprot:TRINITY_DN2098_c0_g1_i1.p2 TRINITY_DN2098_c0_g1~~TRINITY_DN2098_c0_g1_i1.p2  ORF type:complete len:189 (-),score=6.67 TRINITY_DN2098_c0_g1_i1:823-1389(-)
MRLFSILSGLSPRCAYLRSCTYSCFAPALVTSHCSYLPRSRFSTIISDEGKSSPLPPRYIPILSQQISHIVRKIQEYRTVIDPYRKSLVGKLEESVKKSLAPQPAKLIVYGSTTVGLDIETSDIDTSIVGIKAENRADMCDALIRLEEELKTRNYFESIKVILESKIPIMKLVQLNSQQIGCRLQEIV